MKPPSRFSTFLTQVLIWLVCLMLAGAIGGQVTLTTFESSWRMHHWLAIPRIPVSALSAGKNGVGAMACAVVVALLLSKFVRHRYNSRHEKWAYVHSLVDPEGHKEHIRHQANLELRRQQRREDWTDRFSQSAHGVLDRRDQRAVERHGRRERKALNRGQADRAQVVRRDDLQGPRRPDPEFGHPSQWYHPNMQDQPTDRIGYDDQRW